MPGSQPAELALLLNSRADRNADWSFNYGLDLPNHGVAGSEYRSIYNETRTDNLSFGLRGDVEALDGSWDVIVSRGHAKLDVLLKGYASLERLRTVFRYHAQDWRQRKWGRLAGWFLRRGEVTAMRHADAVIAVSRLLPSELIPAAKVMHSNEALLALLIVLVWHMAGAHLNPEVFPMDTSIFTGKISKERLRHEHPMEFEERFGKR